MNIITIANDEKDIEMIETYRSINTQSEVSANETELGISKLGEIEIPNRSDSAQVAIKFKDDVEVLYKGIYSGGISGEYDFIGCQKNGKYKWIHGQLMLNENNTNDMKLLKSLINYALK